MRDQRDPEELYKAILATRNHFACSILEAADRVELMRDDLITNGRNSYVATPGAGPTTYIPLSSVTAEGH